MEDCKIARHLTESGFEYFGRIRLGTSRFLRFGMGLLELFAPCKGRDINGTRTFCFELGRSVAEKEKKGWALGALTAIMTVY